VDYKNFEVGDTRFLNFFIYYPTFSLSSSTEFLKIRLIFLFKMDDLGDIWDKNGFLLLIYNYFWSVSTA
jgi:hypothetical protein